MYAYKQNGYASGYYQSYLGEINNKCNINFALDGTKDNAKVEIFNFDENIILPYTILKEENTGTWWIVKKDRVERHKNESGYFYKHQLELLGATELLNARDLTDCGFNANRYTIRESITRLFKLSTIYSEIPNLTIMQTTNLDLDQIVTFTKTYENYTLLSALRELLSAYNCDLKITFDTYGSGSNPFLTRLYVHIYSKTGEHQTTTVVSGDVAFTDIRELKELDSNSFGSVVVSNASNVVSSQPITFPSAGWCKLTCEIYQVDISYPPSGDNENARTTARSLCIKLPSNVFKVNYVDFTLNGGFTIRVKQSGNFLFDYPTYPLSPTESQYALLTALNNSSASVDFKNYVYAHLKDIIEKVNKGLTWRFYDGAIYDPQNNTLVPPSNAPSDFRIIDTDNNDGTTPKIPFVLLDKDQREHLDNVEKGFYWERGKDTIKGWERFAMVHAYDKKHIWTDQNIYGSQTTYTYGEYTFEVFPTTVNVDLDAIRCRVNYVPMSDLKIKVDNDIDTHNVKLFNQTGKLTDGVAFSKRLDSYSKEISSDNITRYAQTYNYENIYKVGKIISFSGVYYIINNVSIDIYKHDLNYFYDCEYTLSKQVAVKSLMVNPDTNIRDYVIPQNNNVVRKTIFRDYYTFELNGTLQTNEYNYAQFTDLDIFRTYNETLDTYLVAIEVIFSSGSKYYYQLSTSRYNLKKMKIYTVNFNDNNIIGYDCQNRWSGFNISRLLTNYSLVTCPIQYTDDNGEVQNIYLHFVDNDRAAESYSNLGSSYAPYYSNIVYIGSDSFTTIYDELETNQNFYWQGEYPYQKDALEVPFFEYCVQFNDSDSVLVGDNVLNTYDDCVYVYGYARAYNSNIGITIDNYGALTFSTPSFSYNSNTNVITVSNGCNVTCTNNEMVIEVFNNCTLNVGTLEKTTGTRRQSDGTIGIYRYAFNKITKQLVATDLMFVIKNVKSDSYSSGQLHIAINHYELK